MIIKAREELPVYLRILKLVLDTPGINEDAMLEAIKNDGTLCELSMDFVRAEVDYLVSANGIVKSGGKKVEYWPTQEGRRWLKQGFPAEASAPLRLPVER